MVTLAVVVTYTISRFLALVLFLVADRSAFCGRLSVTGGGCISALQPYPTFLGS